MRRLNNNHEISGCVQRTLIVLITMFFSAQIYAAKGTATESILREWRRFPVPWGTREIPRPPDAEFLKVLPPLRPEPKFSKRAQELGVAIWWGDYSVPLFSEQPPTAADLRRQPMVCSPAGEEEPIVLGLWGLRDVGAVSLSIKRSPLPVTIRYVEFAPRKVPGDNGGDSVKGGRIVGFATYLPEQGTGQVRAKKNTAFWINFEALPDTKPGRYTVTLQLIVHELQKIIELPVTVEVLGFSLPKPDIAYGMFFRPFDPCLPARYRTPELLRAYLRDMARHGMNSATLYNYAAWKKDAEGNLNLDGNPDIELLKEMMREGLVSSNIPILWLPGYDVEAAQGIADEVRKRHWPEFLFYGPDEPPVNEEALANINKRQSMRMHFRSITAISDHAATAYADFLDIWMVNGGCITPALCELAARKKAELWTYDCSHRGAGNAPWSRFYAGLYTWALRLKGNFLWCYTENYAWEGDRNAIYCYVLPSDGGTVPSIEWEARREGIEDYRTLRSLESRIAIHTNSDVARQAYAWLQQVRKRVDWYLAREMPPSLYGWDGPELYPMCPNFDPAELSGIRNRAVSFILKLR